MSFISDARIKQVTVEKAKLKQEVKEYDFPYSERTNNQSEETHNF